MQSWLIVKVTSTTLTVKSSQLDHWQQNWKWNWKFKAILYHSNLKCKVWIIISIYFAPKIILLSCTWESGTGKRCITEISEQAPKAGKHLTVAWTLENLASLVSKHSLLPCQFIRNDAENLHFVVGSTEWWMPIISGNPVPIVFIGVRQYYTASSLYEAACDFIWRLTPQKENCKLPNVTLRGRVQELK